MSEFIILVTIFNLLIFKNNIKIANFLNLYDRPDNLRKIHNQNIPLTGGVIILFNIVILFFFLLIQGFFLITLKFFKMI
jgi:UDP-N-acetylmuramyl pentapeptide phosphotransferase/UDP-N-acetylglucosamine-1-phosphate transferase